MAETCCGRRAARVTTENISQSLQDLENSIESHGFSATGLERDPDCECDPCMCPSDDVPCNARYLGNDLSDQGLQQALNRLVRHARQIQAAQGDACDCVDQPPFVAPAARVVRRERGFFGLPQHLRFAIYGFAFGDAARLLSEIESVRVRQGKEAKETRIVRNLARTRKVNRRHVFDPQQNPEGRHPYWNGNIPMWERETAAITYEASIDDDALAELPYAGERLSLLCVSKRFREDAGHFFFARNFRFTQPRNENMIPEDEGIFHGILAADAFFTNRSTYNRNQFTQIELDLTEPTPDRGVGDPEYRPVVMESSSNQSLNFVDGLDRLENLSNTLRQMPFQDLKLTFGGIPHPWLRRKITVSGPILFMSTIGFPLRNGLPFRHSTSTNTSQDPRQEEDEKGFKKYPWTEHLFSLGPRKRLRLNLRFEYKIYSDQSGWERQKLVYDAMYMMRIIRSFLLTNAQVLEDQYEGIRVLIWDSAEDDTWEPRIEAYASDRLVILECDDEYFPGINAVESRLGPRDFDGPGQMRAPDISLWASREEDRPEEVPPPPPRSEPSPEQEPEEAPRTGRQRPAPPPAPISILDQD